MENTQVLGSRLSAQDQIAPESSIQWFLAKGISIIFSPPLLGVVGLFLLGVQLSTVQSWGWLSVYVGFNILAPLTYLAYLLHIGGVSDFHMKGRLERVKPLRAILLFFFLSWLVFLASGAPVVFQVFALIGTLQSAAMFLITLRWKISGHGAGVAGFSVLLWGLYGLAAAPAFLFIPLVIWARLSLERHDLPQTIAGVLLGSAGMWLAFYLLASQCQGLGLLCV